MTIPAAGWATNPLTGHPTYTVHGPSFGIRPPAREGFRPHFIARHGNDYTTWTYRPEPSS